MPWGAVAGGVASAVVGSALASDHGATSANNAAADASRIQADIARQQWDRYKSIYAPMEDRFVSDAQNYDSPEAYQRAAGEASATVASQFAKARDRLERTPGMDPSSGAYQSGMLGLELGQAAADATQQNLARKNVRDTAWARKTDALSLGKGLPAQASSMLGSSASTNLSLANAGMAQANREASAIGNIAQTGMNAWLKGYTPNTNGAGVTNTSRGMDFSDNMQEYGI